MSGKLLHGKHETRKHSTECKPRPRL